MKSLRVESAIRTKYYFCATWYYVLSPVGTWIIQLSVSEWSTVDSENKIAPYRQHLWPHIASGQKMQHCYCIFHSINKTINTGMGKENSVTLLSVSLIASSLKSIVLSSVLINNSGFRFFQLNGSIPNEGGLQNIKHTMHTRLLVLKIHTTHVWQTTMPLTNSFDLSINFIN